VTDTGDPASPPPGSEFMADNSEWEQAVYTLRAFELAHELGVGGADVLVEPELRLRAGASFRRRGIA
jgi:hypothetical protein